MFTYIMSIKKTNKCIKLYSINKNLSVIQNMNNLSTIYCIIYKKPNTI